MSDRDARPQRSPDEDSATTATEADRYEQNRPLIDDESVQSSPPSDDVDPADAQEQQRSVPQDEDEYR